MFPVSDAAHHSVSDADRAIAMTRNCRVLVDIMGHETLWLIADHGPKDSGTHRTLGPVFLPDQVLQTAQMELV